MWELKSLVSGNWASFIFFHLMSLMQHCRIKCHCFASWNNLIFLACLISRQVRLAAGHGGISDAQVPTARKQRRFDR